MIANWVRISDYLWFQEGPGVRNYQYTDSGVKLLNVANFVNGALDISNTSRFISEEEAYGRYSHFLVDDGDFIIASSGIKVETFDEKMGFASADDLPLCMNTSTIRFKVIDPDKVDIRFFMYYLKSLSFKRQLSKQITGSAQLNFGPSHLKKMSFPLYGLDFQHEVALRLDKLQAAVDAQQHRLQQFETLVKSRFIEMFGDPIGRPHYETKPLGSLFQTSSGGTPSKKVNEYWDGGTIPWIGSNMCQDRFITETDGRFITEEGLNHSSAKLLRPGTVLVALVGATIGKTALLKCETTTNQNIAAIDVAANESFIPEYVFFSMQHLYPEFMRMGGGDFKMASQSFVRTLPIMVSPLEQQQEFAAFVQQVDKSKVAVQKAIDKLELLKASLMQEYFG